MRRIALVAARVVVLSVGENVWERSVVAHVSGSGPLAIGAMVTPEGLALDRPGHHTDRIYPFTQVGEPNITYHAIGGSEWTTIFQ